MISLLCTFLLFQSALGISPGRCGIEADIALQYLNSEGFEEIGIQNSLGNVNNQVFLVRFKDHSTRPLPAPSEYQTQFDTAINGYYHTQSNGRFNLISHVSTRWIDLNITEVELANGCNGLCTPQMMYQMIADVKEEYGVIPGATGTTIIHSGYGAEWTGNGNHIWSHARGGGYAILSGLYGSSGSMINVEGVIIHELGHHLFGLPDLYDSTAPPSSSLGDADIMCDAWHSPGNPPHPLSAWSKTQLGWVDIFSPETDIPQDVSDPTIVYKIDHGPMEYLLIDYDGTGVLVFHIDDRMGTRWNRYQTVPSWSNWTDVHYRIRLIQKGGNFHLELNPWQGVWPVDKYYEDDRLDDDT